MAAGRHLEKNGYDVITPPKIVGILRNLAGRCKNGMPMTAHTSKSKPEIQFQYGDRTFSETGSSFILAVDWDISSKFGRQIDLRLLKQIPSLSTNPELDFHLYGRRIENIYDVITPPPIIRSLRSLAGRCKMPCR